MNTAFLLIVGLAILFLGHRYGSRFLSVSLYSPLSQGTSSAEHHNSGATGSLPGALMVYSFGAAYALAWGWAPLYVWILCAGTVIGILLHGALDWYADTHRGLSALDMLYASGGRQSAQTGSLIVFILGCFISAAVLLAGSALLLTYPGAIQLLFIHILTALLFALWVPGHMKTRVLFQYLFGLLVIPAAGWSLFFAPGEQTQNPATAFLLCMATVVILALLRQKNISAFCRVSSRMGAAALATLIVVTTLALLIQRPEAGFLAYSATTGQDSALPLLMGLLPITAWTLLQRFARTESDSRTDISSSTAYRGNYLEGGWLLMILLVLISYPSLFPENGLNLPAWNASLDMTAYLDFLVMAVAGTSALLPLPETLVVSLCVYILVLFAWHFVLDILSACQHTARPLIQWLPQPRADLATQVLAPVIIVFLALLILRFSLSVSLLSLAGAAGLLLLNLVSLSAAFNLYRLERSAGILSIMAFLTTAATWWLLLHLALRWISGELWVWLGLNLLLIFVTAILHLRWGNNFHALYAARLKADTGAGLISLDKRTG